MSSAQTFSPNNRQPQLQGRYAAPGSEEVSCFRQLHFGRTRRMIGNDQVQSATSESAPELLPIFTFTNWRTAFEFRGTVGNLFGSKRQVVRASFRGDLQARGFRFA
jgi:hypothetical protein